MSNLFSSIINKSEKPSLLTLLYHVRLLVRRTHCDQNSVCQENGLGLGLEIRTRSRSRVHVMHVHLLTTNDDPTQPLALYRNVLSHVGLGGHPGAGSHRTFWQISDMVSSSADHQGPSYVLEAMSDRTVRSHGTARRRSSAGRPPNRRNLGLTSQRGRNRHCTYSFVVICVSVSLGNQHCISPLL